MSLAYRLRLFSLDRWNLWPRLTRYRRWAGPDGETLDGTNNACERAIGWWVKERYRSMRGYKRPQSVLNVSRLIAAMGNTLDGPGFALAAVIAEREGGGGSTAPSRPEPNSEQSRPLITRYLSVRDLGGGIVGLPSKTRDSRHLTCEYQRRECGGQCADGNRHLSTCLRRDDSRPDVSKLGTAAKSGVRRCDPAQQLVRSRQVPQGGALRDADRIGSATGGKKGERATGCG
jgi:hypothetical protein